MSKFIHLQSKDIKVSVKALEVLLASSYAVYLKTQNFHWNVEDCCFQMLHEFFGDHYEKLAEAIDEIAERIRMLGESSPGSFTEFAKLSVVTDAKAKNNGKDMLRELLSDHSKIIKHIRDSIEKISKGDDQGTLDLFIARLQEHEKFMWMINSHI